MTLRILSGNRALQIMPFRKLGGKCHFFLRFCTRKRSKTYLEVLFRLSFSGPVSIHKTQLYSNLFDRCELTPTWVKGPGATSYTGSPTKQVSFSTHLRFGLYSYVLFALVKNSKNCLYLYDI